MDLGPNPRTVATTGQPNFAHHGASKPKMARSGAKKQQQKGLFGATWLPMGVHALPLSPNDHATMAQVSPRVVRGHSKIAIFPYGLCQPENGGGHTGGAP